MPTTRYIFNGRHYDHSADLWNAYRAFHGYPPLRAKRTEVVNGEYWLHY